jgi:DMSO reductase anchor subunit
MNRNEEYGSLTAFTALSPLAVGGLVGLLLAVGIRMENGIDWAAMIVLVTGILALVASLFHLGRPWRAPLALLRLATSWLSREVILFGLFLLTLACYTLLPIIGLGSLARIIFGFAAVIFGLAGTIATGETYRLRARPSWDQWLAVVSFPLGALSAGSLFGFFVARLFSKPSASEGYLWAGAAVLLVLALIVSWLRSTRISHGSEESRLSRQLVLQRYKGLLLVRVVAIVTALALIVLGGDAKFLAWVPALLGEFADRVLFFKASVPVTLSGRYL